MKRSLMRCGRSFSRTRVSQRPCGDSDKSHALLTMVNAGDHYDPAPIRTAMLTHEGYSLIWRLLQQGPVEVELSLSNSFSREPVDAYNTVAELRGSEKPDEVVIICAHLDSWDLG